MLARRFCAALTAICSALDLLPWKPRRLEGSRVHALSKDTSLEGNRRSLRGLWLGLRSGLSELSLFSLSFHYFFSLEGVLRASFEVFPIYSIYPLAFRLCLVSCRSLNFSVDRGLFCMFMGMDVHRAALARVCRIGGVKFSSSSSPNSYPVSDFLDEMKACSGVGVAMDDPDVHPPSVCYTCRAVLIRCRTAQAVGRPFARCGGGCREVQTWNPHKRVGECHFCIAQQNLSRGGRPKKKRKTPSGCITNTLTGRFCFQDGFAFLSIPCFFFFWLFVFLFFCEILIIALLIIQYIEYN